MSERITVESCADCLIVVDVPAYNIHREWGRRGQKFMFEREVLDQIYYDMAVENLFKMGYLKCDSKEFMKDVGLIDEKDEPVVTPLDAAYIKRLLKNMPLAEFKKEVTKLTKAQVIDLADQAINNPNEFNLDRADLLSKLSGKNILKAIELAKADKED